jgi:hypothetical protein
MIATTTETALLSQIWTALNGDPKLLERIEFTGPEQVLPGPFDVTALAAATVAAATLAVAEFGADLAEVPAVGVDRVAAAAAFRSDALLQPVGWELPPIWDPIAGNYQARDGWIRLHTNYAYHRDAAVRALGLDPAGDVDGEQVAGLVRELGADELEQRVVAEGGCAAALHTGPEWAVHPHGRIAATQPAVTLTHAPSPESAGRRGAGFDVGPLSGLRVLDLTRVMAGPVCTRTLAAWGADVLRIDPPGFAEVPALLPEMTTGKHCTELDLRAEPDRHRFGSLLAEADVIVHGLRPGALAGLGYSDQVLRSINPRLCIATESAYGWDGPWAGRRGFDSLVQLSCGIAAAAAAAVGSDRPGALPCQALDHGVGYLMAAAICRGLTDAGERGPAGIRATLVGTANLLTHAPVSPVPEPGEIAPPAMNLAAMRVRRETFWGPVNAIGQPGTIGGAAGNWRVQAGPLGRHQPQFGG